MTALEFLAAILTPGIAWCQDMTLNEWTAPFDDRARVLMLSIAGQESAWTYRIQSGHGPAHGFNQMERNGGVKGVLTNAHTYKMAMAACAKAGVPANPTQVWGLMATEKGDNLGTAFARLLLWADLAPLPAVGAQDEAWLYYERNWRPGKPRPDDWRANYDAAMAAIKGTPTV